MIIFLYVVIVLASILLILVVLVQKSKGGGLASGFSSSNNIMGVRKTTDVVEKVTWTLAGVVLVLSLVSGRLLHDKNVISITNVPAVQVNTGSGSAPEVDPGVNLTPDSQEQPSAE